MVLDDLESNQSVLRAILRRRDGIQLFEANSCKAALAAVNDHLLPLDLLIADLRLPDGFGTHVAIELHGTNTLLKIIFISGTPLSHWPDEAKRDAAALPSASWEVLEKPFLPVTLMAAVESAVGRSSPESRVEGDITPDA